MPAGSSYPGSSPMALNRGSSPTSSIFKSSKRSSSTPPTSAASYLSALSQADASLRARRSTTSPSPTAASTPALSFSSLLTSTTEVGEEDNSDGLAVPLGKPPNSEQVYTTVHTEFGHCYNESM